MPSQPGHGNFKNSTDFPKITGDDTPAIQAVLDADVWRKRLLADQDVS
jgi:hypothetical protein